jgi:hypothetical protein
MNLDAENLITSPPDLYEQLRADLVALLERHQFKVPEAARNTVDAALRACYRVQHRSIRIQPRRVHRSRELEARLTGGEHLAAVEAIQAEFERGNNINPRLTHRYFDAEFNDPLLNEEGVHHFHLGQPETVVDKTGKHTMAGGGDDLLCAVIRPDDAYFLAIAPHSAVFSSLDFPKIMFEIGHICSANRCPA